MPYVQRFRRSLFAVCVMLLGNLALPGCVPVTWLPDSSGFVYVEPGNSKDFGPPGPGKLMHFDLKKKAARLVLDNVDASTQWPAVSPDGKRIATARIKGEEKKAKTIQIVQYDFDGKEVAKSKEFPWSKPPKEDV